MQKIRIDLRDLKLLKKFRYRLRSKKESYLIRDVGKKPCRSTTSLHRDILQPKKGEYIDHIDGNPLNNSRRNLRLCTNAENARNRGKQKNNTSGFKGVTFAKRRSHLATPWAANIMVDQKTKNLGYYTTPEEAAQTYDKAAIKLFGDFAKLNFKEI